MSTESRTAVDELKQSIASTFPRDPIEVNSMETAEICRVVFSEAQVFGEDATKQKELEALTKQLAALKEEARKKEAERKKTLAYKAHMFLHNLATRDYGLP